VITTSYTAFFTKLQTNSIIARAIRTLLNSARSQAALSRAEIKLKSSMFKLQNATWFLCSLNSWGIREWGSTLLGVLLLMLKSISSNVQINVWCAEPRARATLSISTCALMSAQFHSSLRNLAEDTRWKVSHVRKTTTSDQHARSTRTFKIIDKLGLWTLNQEGGTVLHDKHIGKPWGLWTRRDSGRTAEDYFLQHWWRQLLGQETLQMAKNPHLKQDTSMKVW
jgi:hypothetical protein